MQQKTQDAVLVKRPRRRCPKLHKFAIFLSIAKSALKKVCHIKFKGGRKWEPVDYILVLIYSWTRGISINHACEKMNNWKLRQNPETRYEFWDERHSRLVPHQTSVNDWLRTLTMDIIKELSHAIFDSYARRFFFRKGRSTKVLLQFDFTYAGYWGKRRDKWIKGSIMVKGTRRIRHYHGALVHGAGGSFYVGLHHITKEESKIPFMIETAKWLQKLGLEVEWCAVDREYYGYELISEFKHLGINIITPVKDYNQLKEAKLDYLLNEKGRVREHKLKIDKNIAPNLKKTKIFIVLLGRNKQKLNKIKQEYRKGNQSIYEAMDNIFALLTARAPQYAGKNFSKKLEALYKMRWQIETAFRDNEVHKAIWRSNYDGTRFINELGRFILYNLWQEAKIKDPRGDRLDFQTFRDEMVDEFTHQINL